MDHREYIEYTWYSEKLNELLKVKHVRRKERND